MSSTRHATTNGPLRQERFASSPEFERGLMANLVARRCSVLDDPADRELIWALQYLSHQAGGLKAVADDLLEKFGDCVGTKAMASIGKRAGQAYTADEVREVRKQIPAQLRYSFKLRGETEQQLREIAPLYFERDAELRELAEEALLNAEGDDWLWDPKLREAKRQAERALEIAKAAKHPTTYPVAAFLKICRDPAEIGAAHDRTQSTEGLEDQLRRLCLDPAFSFQDGAPWYFARLITTLRDYIKQRTETRASGIVVTTLGEKVHETLDYTQQSQTMTLVEGGARIGKSFAARSWCEQHPGQARFVEVPPGNDDIAFYRALARGLGLGNFTKYKAAEIRDRVENVLLTGDLLLCLDEAHRLWPQTGFRYGFPKRIEWVMAMRNKGVPICMVSTPQFIGGLKVTEHITGWNSAQLIGRFEYYPLPRELELEDLMAVARSVLPEADTRSLRALAAYARTSARYLAAIDAIAKRARYIAGRDGRPTATTDDVRRAMRESVIPADSKLVRALKSVEKPAGRSARRPVASPLLDAGSEPAEEAQTRESGRGIGAGPAREIAPPGLASRACSLELHPA
jgi:hypothetical protein